MPEKVICAEEAVAEKKPSPVIRFRAEIELFHPRTLANVLRFMRFRPEIKAHEVEVVKRVLTQEEVLDYLRDNPNAFDTLMNDKSIGDEIKQELSGGRKQPKLKIHSGQVEIAKGEVKVPKEHKKLLDPSPPAPDVPLILVPGENTTRPGQIIGVGDKPEKKQEKVKGPNLDLHQTDGNIFITQADSLQAYWSEIYKNWEKLVQRDPKLARSLINIKHIKKDTLARILLNQGFSPDYLEFDPNSGLSQKDLDLLKIWEPGFGGGVEMRYNPEVKVTSREEHVASVNLLAELAGVKTYLNNPSADPRLVYKNQDNAAMNEKGFSYHFHTSAEKGTPVSQKEENQILELARILALKKEDWRQVGTRVMWGKGPNKYGASFEWRDHYLSPKEEAELAEKFMSLDHKGREEFLKTELNIALSNPVVMSRLSESLTDASRPLFLETWNSSGMEEMQVQEALKKGWEVAKRVFDA